MDETPPGVWLARRALWIVLAWLSVLTGADADLWGHLRFGLDFLRDWRWPAIDPYSYSQDVPWVNHEWLSEALMAASYRLGATPGLVLLKAALVGLAYVLIIRAYRKAAPLAGELLALAVAIGSLSLTMSVRPQIWSFAALAVLLRLMSENRHQAWIPLVFAIWVNVHGGWIIGLAALGLWLLAEARSRRRLILSLCLLGLASLAATVVNPYGWGLWSFIARTVRLSRADISEWQPIWADSWLAIASWIVALALLVVCAARKVSRPRVDVIVTLAGLAYAATRVQRLGPFHLEASVLLLAPSLTALFPASLQSGAPRLSEASFRWVNVPLAIVIAAFAAYSALPHLRCIPPLPRSAADTTAAAALRGAGVKGRLAVEFDWGEYAIWHFAPRLLVSIDGRRETIYSPVRLEEQAALRRGSPFGFEVLARDRPEYVWMRKSRTALADGLTASGYRVDVQTPDSFVAVRDDVPRLAPAPPVSTGCFPNP